MRTLSALILVFLAADGSKYPESSRNLIQITKNVSEPASLTILRQETDHSFLFSTTNFKGFDFFFVSTFIDPTGAYDNFKPFVFENNVYSVFNFVGLKNADSLEFKFKEDCVLPIVAVAVDQLVSFGMLKDGLSLKVFRAEAIGISGFNLLGDSLDSRVFESFDQSLAVGNTDIFNQKISIANLNKMSEINISIYCPLFSDPIKKRFAFEIKINKPKFELETSLSNELNSVSNFTRVFAVPEQGKHVISIASLAQQTKFIFNTTDSSEVEISFEFDFDRSVYSFQYGKQSIILPKAEHIEITILNSSQKPQYVQMFAFQTNEVVYFPSKVNVELIVGVVIGSVAFLVILGLLIYFRKRIFICWHKAECDTVPSNSSRGSPEEIQRSANAIMNTTVIAIAQTIDLFSMQDLISALNRHNDLNDSCDLTDDCSLKGNKAFDLEETCLECDEIKYEPSNNVSYKYGNCERLLSGFSVPLWASKGLTLKEETCCSLHIDLFISDDIQNLSGTFSMPEIEDKFEIDFDGSKAWSRRDDVNGSLNAYLNSELDFLNSISDFLSEDVFIESSINNPDDFDGMSENRDCDANIN